MLSHEVAELRWENGQLATHGLGPPRVSAKPAAYTSPSKYTCDKARVNGTLESLVNQATCLPGSKPNLLGSQELVPWLDHHNHRHVLLPQSASANMTMDALFPCSNRTENLCIPDAAHLLRAGVLGTCSLGCSTRLGCCSGHTATRDEEDGHLLSGKRARVARVPVTPIREQSVSGGANTFRRYSKHGTLDTRERDMSGAGFTSASFGSQENTSTGGPMTATANDENDPVCHSRPQREAGEEEDKKKRTGKSSVSAKRSRAAAIHNQSERKRRDKINERMKTLQKMVPNSSKTDKASMLDEVIDYLKQLQAQAQIMSRMNMQSMMLPMAMQQQLQMSMMAAMSVGMGMGMGVMDMTQIARPNVAGIPPVQHPTVFVPMTSWDGSTGGDHHRLLGASSTVMPVACQAQPMTLDAYSRMAAMYHQLQQQQQQLSPNFRS